MVKDHQQLWEDITTSRTAYEAKAVPTLIEILADKEGRDFISRLERKDAESCIEILGHGIAEHGLGTAEKNAFFVTLRRLAGYHGRLPHSMMIKEKLEVSGEVLASGGFADIRREMYMGQPVAVKTMRVTQEDDFLKIRKQFYKEVVLWGALSHPNILNLVGVQGDMEKKQLATVSEWMAHGNIMEYIQNNHANRLELLLGAAEGLKYLHGKDLIHGDLKGANILMSNATPPRACLADFGFMTVVFNPMQPMSCSAQLEGGTLAFMSPELLVPSKFEMKNSVPTPEGDIYAFGLVIFQVLTGHIPFHGVRQTELGWSVVEGLRPVKPENASSIGFSDLLWSFIQRCWDGNMKLRPKVAEVVTHLEGATANWKELMPPSVQAKNAASDSKEEKSGSVDDCKIFQHSPGVDLEATIDSQTASGPFNPPTTLFTPHVSTQYTEPLQEELQEAITKPPQEPQPESQVPVQPRFKEPHDELHAATSHPQLAQYPSPSQLPQTKRKGLKRFKPILRVLFCFKC